MERQIYVTTAIRYSPTVQIERLHCIRRKLSREPILPRTEHRQHHQHKHLAISSRTRTSIGQIPTPFSRPVYVFTTRGDTGLRHHGPAAAILAPRTLFMASLRVVAITSANSGISTLTDWPPSVSAPMANSDLHITTNTNCIWESIVKVIRQWLCLE